MDFRSWLSRLWEGGVVGLAWTSEGAKVPIDNVRRPDFRKFLLEAIVLVNKSRNLKIK
jgi:hypothetical protein